MPHDPSSGVTFGAYMRGGKPLGQGRSADVVLGERTWLTQDQVHEGRTADGVRFKETLDQLGHQVVEETLPDGQERKHVRLNLQ
ncbi:hypothetical protein [Nonomuraea sp. NPDC049141]|uniref:hypothetical protein n=1 Tax=Nonomuraea sp. NPDC049141 TaxID=3155500 RepID=UPI003401385E